MTTSTSLSAQTLSGAEATLLTIDGVSPRQRVSPSTADDVAAALSEAVQGDQCVAPRGGGTQMGLGHSPTRLDTIIDLSRLNAIVAHDPEELTAVVQAGAPFAEMQRVFAAQGQWLALDPPLHEGATLGGVLATNASGPHRLRYGTARDLVLGMQVAYADQQPRLAKSGSRMVKSVSGYDIHKVHTGALGTLGIITQVNLRLHPLPAAREIVVCPVPAVDRAGLLAQSLLRQPLQLGALELLNAAALHSLGIDPVAGAMAYVVALCEGHPRTTSRQRDEIARAAQALDLQCQSASATEMPTFLAAFSHLSRAETPDQTVWFVGVPLSRVAAAYSIVERLLAEQEGQTRLAAHLGSGIVQAVFTAPPAQLAELVETARRDLSTLGGHLVVRTCPSAAKTSIDVWGPTPGSALMRRLKDELDPSHVLNRGRYVRGIDDVNP